MNTLISLLIFSLPLGVVLRVKLFQNVYFYPIDIIVGLIFLLTLYKIIIQKEDIQPRQIFKYLVAFLAIGLISLIVNINNLSIVQFAISLSYAVRFAAYASILFAVQFLKNKQKDALISKLLISGGTFVILGFIQYFFYNDLRNLSYLEWDIHLFRLFSTFFDPNFAGAYLVLIFLLTLGSFFNDKNKLLSAKKICYVMLGAGALISIILTYSRSALLVLIVGICVFMIFRGLVRQLVVIVIGIVAVYFLFANYQIEGLNPFRLISAQSRLTSVGQTVYVFEKNPILGVGFNSFRYAQVRYNFRNKLGISLSNADSGADNSFLFIAATCGIIGFSLFILYLYTIFKTLFFVKKSNVPRSWLAQVAISSLVVVLFDSLFINSFFYIFILAWIMILLGITVYNTKIKSRIKRT